MAARKKAKKTRTSRASRTSSKTRSSRARTVTKKARTPRTAKKAGKARPSRASARSRSTTARTTGARPARSRTSARRTGTAPTMAARGAPRTAAVMPKKTLVGTVSHYFGGIGVGVIEVIRDLKVGDTISIEGSTTNFTQKVTSLQIERMSVSEVKAGESVGIKVVDKIREGDRVFRA